MILIFLLTGCNSQTSIKPESQNLSFTAVCSIDGFEYIFTALTDNEANLCLTQVSPEENQNLKISFNNDTVFLNYLELEKEFKLSNFSADSPFRILGEAFNALNSSVAFSNEDNRLVLDFKADNQKFKLYLSETGLPLEIQAEDPQNNIIFKGITILSSN